MRAFKIHETLNFQEDLDPYKSMQVGRYAELKVLRIFKTKDTFFIDASNEEFYDIEVGKTYKQDYYEDIGWVTRVTLDGVKKGWAFPDTLEYIGIDPLTDKRNNFK